jgi:hypothetical protein
LDKQKSNKIKALIKQMCVKHDPKKTGLVEVTQFMQFLDSFGINIKRATLEQVAKHQKRGDNLIQYRKALKVIAPQGQTKSSYQDY